MNHAMHDDDDDTDADQTGGRQQCSGITRYQVMGSQRWAGRQVHVSTDHSLANHTRQGDVAWLSGRCTASVSPNGAGDKLWLSRSMG